MLVQNTICIPLAGTVDDLVLQRGEVIDIGGSELPALLRTLLKERLLWTKEPYCVSGLPQRLLPSPLLSDDQGLKIWDRINCLPTYYQTDSEIELFRQRGLEISSYIHPSTILIDLGCGDVRKVQPLLDTFELLEKPVWYFALDLSHEALVRAMESLSSRYKHVFCVGLWGTFDDGLKFCNSFEADRRPRLWMSLGSIFGNDHFGMAVARLKFWKSEAMNQREDAMLLTMDATNDPKTLWDSYHDSEGLFEEFIRNGYRYSNAVLGVEWYRDDEWEHVGVIQEDPDMHRFVLRARNDISCPELDLTISQGEEIDCYEAFKYGPEMMRRQFGETGLQEIACWKASNSNICELISPASSQSQSDNVPYDIDQYLLTPSRVPESMSSAWSDSWQTLPGSDLEDETAEIFCS